MKSYILPAKNLHSALIMFAALLLLSFGSSSFAATKKDKADSKYQADAAKLTLIVFPFDSDSVTINNEEDVDSMLNDVAMTRLDLSNTYSPMRYSRGLPPVALALIEGDLTTTDVKPPYSGNNAKIIKLTKTLDYQCAFVGSIDDYNYDKTAGKVEITLSASLINVVSGKVIKLAVRTGYSVANPKMKEDDLAINAARSTCESLMNDLTPLPASTNTSIKKKDKQK
jgi:hypothetical protein